MAKNNKSLDRALSKAVDEILKSYKSAMTEAVKFATKQAEKDFMKKAHSCLQEYYDNFIPNSYDRTETLQYAFLPYSNVKYGSDKISGQVGVEYSADMLEQMMPPPTYSRDGKIIHKGYYGSSAHQPVDAWWVIENYLMGLHPDGGDDREFFISDSKSPNEKMNEFIKSYASIWDENVFAGLLAQIAKKIN